MRLFTRPELGGGPSGAAEASGPVRAGATPLRRSTTRMRISRTGGRALHVPGAAVAMGAARRSFLVGLVAAAVAVGLAVPLAPTATAQTPIVVRGDCTSAEAVTAANTGATAGACPNTTGSRIIQSWPSHVSVDGQVADAPCDEATASPASVGPCPRTRLPPRARNDAELVLAERGY